MLPTHGPDSKYDIILDGENKRGKLTFTPHTDSMMKVGTIHNVFSHLETHTCTCICHVHVHCRGLHVI